MNMNTARYRVDIPCHIVVYLDNNFAVTSHDLDLETVNTHGWQESDITAPDSVPEIIDYWTDTEIPAVVSDPSDIWGLWHNAFNYARGLYVHHASKVIRVGSALEDKEPF